jgi:hypothetical protein
MEVSGAAAGLPAPTACTSPQPGAPVSVSAIQRPQLGFETPLDELTFHYR